MSPSVRMKDAEIALTVRLHLLMRTSVFFLQAVFLRLARGGSVINDILIGFSD